MRDRLPQKLVIFCRNDTDLRGVLEILDREGYVWDGGGDALDGLDWLWAPTYIYAEDKYLSFDKDDDYCHHMTKHYGYVELTPGELSRYYHNWGEAFTHIDKTSKNNKEISNMQNNILNLNIKFGQNTDEYITGTVMGVAVKGDDGWRIYDKKKKEITSLGNMPVGGIQTFLVPCTKVAVGDLIRESDEYYYVTKVNKNDITALSIETNEVKTIVPVKNILGFTFYTKVVSLTDYIDDNSSDIDPMVLMAMSGAQGGDVSQLLPLLMFKDKLGADDDISKLLLCTTMTSSGNNNQMSQLLPLLLLKDSGNDDDTTKLMLASTMMNGSGDGNAMLPFLMLKALGKDKKPTATGEAE